MWPFKQKKQAKSEPTIRDVWSVSEGTHDGKPLIVRVNRGVSEAIRHPSYSHQLGVAVPLHTPDPLGFPGPDEGEQLNQIEDLLAERLGSDRQCLHVATISTSGMREFVFYSSDPSATTTLLERIGAEITTHEIQHIIQEDPDWDVYQQFA